MPTPLSEALPTAYEFGRVIGRFLRAVGDGEDVDSVPEAVPATGAVTFTPITTSRILIDSSSEPSPLITHEAIACTLDAYGHISRNGVRGVWLWTGVWNVAFNVSGISRTQFPILVTNAHTDVAPLDLWEAAPYTPPTGVTVTTMLVPTNPTDGYVLKWSAASSSLVWAASSGGSSSTLTPVTSNTTPAAGTTAGALIGYRNTSGASVTAAGFTVLAGEGIILEWSGAAWAKAASLPALEAGTGPDITAPTWSATLTTGTPATTSVVVAASALAMDAVGVTGYERSINSGSTWAAIVPSGLNFTIAGLTAGTGYPAPQFRAKDAAGNYSTPVLSAQAFTTPASADTTAPTWSATFTMGDPSTTTVTATASALAMDAVGVTGYEVSYNSGSTYATIVPAGSVFTLTGAPSTTYATTKLRAFDAAGNRSTPALSVPSYTMDAPAVDSTPPTPGTLAASSVKTTGFTLTASGATDETAMHATPYAFSTDNGTTWTAWQASNVYAAAGLAINSTFTCVHKVRDAATNEATGTAITAYTDPSVPLGLRMSSYVRTAESFTLTANAMDLGVGLHATPYAFSIDNGSTWSDYQASTDYSTGGLAGDTVYQCKMRARDKAGNTGTLATAIPTRTLITSPTPVGAATVTRTGGAFSDTAGASFTFSAVPIGTAWASRLVVVALMTSAVAGRNVNALTIGGITPTVVRSANAAWSLNYAYAIVPTGTTADVVVTFDGSCNYAAVEAFVLTNVNTSTHAGSTKALPAVAKTVTTPTVPANGIVLDVGVGSSTEAPTWTGATAIADTTHGVNRVYSGTTTPGSVGDVTTTLIMSTNLMPRVHGTISFQNA